MKERICLLAQHLRRSRGSQKIVVNNTEALARQIAKDGGGILMMLTRRSGWVLIKESDVGGVVFFNKIYIFLD
jgi:hypothetical protein